MIVFQNIEAWHWIMFAPGYLSVIASALASRAVHATPSTIVTMPPCGLLQSWAMISALFEMHFKPRLWSKTQHGITTSRPVL